MATSPLPTLCCSTNSTLAALSAASHASTAATMPLVSINPIASPFAINLLRLFLIQNFHRLSCDDQFFIRWNDPYLRARVVGVDFAFAAARIVLFLIQVDAGPVQ